MPIYEFQCECGLTSEEIRKLGDTEPPNCVCGKKMERVFSMPVVVIGGPAATQAKLKKRSDEQGKRFFSRAAYRALKKKRPEQAI